MTAPPSPPPTAQRRALDDRLEQVDRDLAELAEQVASGEIDETTAGRLRAAYRSERRDISDRIAAGEEPADDGGRSRRRALLGVGAMVVALAAVTVVLATTVGDRRPGDLATGGIVSDVADGGVDLSTVTNEEMEAVVAENPDVIGMRLALAGRYFEAGEFSKALPHFTAVLDRDPDNAEALARSGWMVAPDRPDVAERLVERAIAAEPGYAEAYWFLGNIRLSGLDDPAGAIEPLEQLLEMPGIPDEIVEATEEMLAQAREGS